MRITAITLIVLGLVLGTGETLSAQELGIEPKSPQVAQLYALLCPGCGHFYSGETVKGAVIATVSVGAVFGGMVAQMNQKPRLECDTPQLHGSTPECRARGDSLKPMLVGTAIGLAGYLYGLIDAGPSARRMRAKSGFEVGPFEMRPSLDWDGDSGVSVMLRVAPGQ